MWGGSLILLITTGSGYLNNQNQRTAGSEYFKTSPGFMKELANTHSFLGSYLTFSKEIEYHSVPIYTEKQPMFGLSEGRRSTGYLIFDNHDYRSEVGI